MINKKNSFFTFCFSLLPGAAHMYMGFMKRGISLMSAFFLLIFITSWLQLGTLMLAMPVLWFFAFFDVHNLRSMPDEIFGAIEDNYINIPGFAKEKALVFREKYRTIFALVLILIGFSILWNNMYDLIDELFPNYISDMLSDTVSILPQLFIGLGIIALGLYLIIGKKKDLDSADKTIFLQDKGGMDQ